MQLSAELYRQIVKSLRSDPRSSRNLEKRIAPRVGLRSKLTIARRMPGGAPPVQAVVWVRDLSTSGIGIVVVEPLPMRSEFVALLPGALGESMSIIYTVVHCKELAKSLYSIGATLTRIE
jgi:hypothetical protein